MKKAKKGMAGCMDDKAMSAIEGSPEHESAESGAMEHAEPPSEHELDMHYDTLMKAEAVKGNPHIMKHLKPHIAKKSTAHKKIESIADIREASKKLGPN